MRWEDIDEHTDRSGGKYLKIRVRSNTKQGKARDVIPMPSARGCLSEWFRLSGNPEPQRLVWHGQESKLGCEESAPTDLNKTFQNFLRRVPYRGRAEGLLCDADGLRRTLYSLRHTYATFALIDGNLTELELARNTGTSVAQIERHYSHVKNTQRAAKLSDMKLPGKDYVAMRNAMALQDAIDKDAFRLIAEQIDEEIDRLPG
jgi:integrase